MTKAAEGGRWSRTERKDGFLNPKQKGTEELDEEVRCSLLLFVGSLLHFLPLVHPSPHLAAVHSIKEHVKSTRVGSMSAWSFSSLLELFGGTL